MSVYERTFDTGGALVVEMDRGGDKVLTVVIDGDSHLVTADQFRTLVDVAVRVMKDAAATTGVDFTVGGLHASEPTIQWEPYPTSDASLGEEFDRLVNRLDHGIAMLEDNIGLPDWMTEATANALYQASSLFDDTAIKGIVFERERRRRKITRRTYRTLDRVFHQQSDAIGSVTGVLVTATLRKGCHLTVRDELTGRGVWCGVDQRTLRESARWIGERVTAFGRIRRDHRGQPIRVFNAAIEREPDRTRVTVAEMAGAFEGGPDSTEWLREQRG